MPFLRAALHTYLFLIPIIVLVLCEITKVAVESWRTGNWQAKLFHPGGIPSSHSAFVTSLIIVVGRKLGMDTVEFAIAVVFACITWYDAMSSRRAIGEQAKVLNRLQHWQKFSTQLGHSARQVLAGILFGAAVTMVGIAVAA